MKECGGIMRIVIIVSAIIADITMLLFVGHNNDRVRDDAPLIWQVAEWLFIDQNAVLRFVRLTMHREEIMDRRSFSFPISAPMPRLP